MTIRPADPIDRRLDDLSLSLGATLRRLRETNGVSVAALAEAVGVSAEDLDAWERGDSLPPLMHLLDMADNLGHDLGPFFGWTEAGAGEVVASEGESTPVASELVEVQPGAPSEAMTLRGPAIVIAVEGELLVTGPDRVAHRVKRGEALRVPDAAVLRVHAGGNRAAAATIVPVPAGGGAA